MKATSCNPSQWPTYSARFSPASRITAACTLANSYSFVMEDPLCRQHGFLEVAFSASVKLASGCLSAVYQDLRYGLNEWTHLTRIESVSRDLCPSRLASRAEHLTCLLAQLYHAHELLNRPPADRVCPMELIRNIAKSAPLPTSMPGLETSS